MATRMDEQDFKFPDEVENNSEDEVRNDDIEVEIEDDTPEEDRNKPPLPQNLKEELEKDGLEIDKYDEEVKKKLKQMKKVWHDERREKEAALREQEAAVAYAKKLRDENLKMKNILQAGEKQYVDSIVTAADLQLKMAEQAYKEAYESGDSDKIVEANKALQHANLQSIQAKNIKLPSLQEENFDVQNEIEQSRQQVRSPEPDEKAVAWQKRNSWFGQKRGMTAYAYGVHEELRDNGVVVGSDLYYSELDKAIRQRFPEEFEEQEETSTRTEVRKKKPPTVVAPASRSTSSNKVKLTQSELNLAKKLGLTPEKYALEKLKLERTNG
ncbi:hypothetical protein EBT31_07525 [bacterium]|nr:hypothetical protein [bacterium]NBX48762.1 hypothetical protein [bacterium]